jgi:hypothetical protein
MPRTPHRRSTFSGDGELLARQAAADIAIHVVQLVAHRDEDNENHDHDQRHDQRVLDERLTILVASAEDPSPRGHGASFRRRANEPAYGRDRNVRHWTERHYAGLRSELSRTAKFSHPPLALGGEPVGLKWQVRIRSPSYDGVLDRSRCTGYANRPRPAGPAHRPRTRSGLALGGHSPCGCLTHATTTGLDGSPRPTLTAGSS